jgi:hypothetical protein
VHREVEVHVGTSPSAQQNVFRVFGDMLLLSVSGGKPSWN